MLTFACVNWRDYLGRGVEYVNVLYDSIRRNLKDGTEGRFVVFTDDTFEHGYAKGIEIRKLKSGLDGWYNKISLFRDDAFPAGDRVIYFDLDTAIVNSLDAIVAYDGPFAILRDVYRPNGLQSSVMMWEAGKYGYIWEGFEAFGYPKFLHGDQEWIEKSVEDPVIIQRQFPGVFASYKREAQFGIPPKASVIFFHGIPRPHECENWVKNVWKVGGATSAQLELVSNADMSEIEANIRQAESRSGAKWIEPVPEHDGVAIICAGGPSLKEEMASIQAHVQAGAKVFACNAVPYTLATFGVDADFHVIVDARPENAAFVAGINSKTTCLYASTCVRALHDAAMERLVLWHPAFPEALDIVGRDKERAYIGGGTTCGMKAMVLAWVLGYRNIHLYGFDSCYRGNAHHAYPQPLNDGELTVEAEFDGKTYKCSPWMIQQAEDFEIFAPNLMDNGAKLFVHGAGLIPDIASQISKGIFRPEAADFRAQAILRHLEGVQSPKVAEVGVFAGDLSRRLLARRNDLELVMVDSWSGRPENGYAKSGDFHANLNQKVQDEYFELTQKVTAFAGPRAKIIRADSKTAISDIPDNSLDLVFIDADHSYEGCLGDIQAYWPKVRPGGWIAGHDYDNDEWQFGAMVRQAVNEFATAKKLELELGENYTWFARKTGEAA
ncbi:MAG TPA: class I SAM-dependent methyltransferase [Terriglobales bacterium]|nr:class I SAM-dependent methyltransferase [Terriglobales bacterium]